MSRLNVVMFMDLERKIDLIKQVGEEIITEEELRELLQTKEHPIAYDGFEPSGIAHMPFGVFRAINLEDMLEAGVRFKLLLADWHAWLNNKMGGDLEKIKKVGEYFIEVWRAIGVDLKNVEVVWGSDLVENKKYWMRTLRVAKNTTLNRAQRALTIMGRKKGELQEVSQFFYAPMQVSDIYQLDVDICQLGLDQRRANILAREIADKIISGSAPVTVKSGSMKLLMKQKVGIASEMYLKFWKPVCVHHHMLMGLKGPKTAEGFEENQSLDVQISSKMSKSKPETCIYVHDSPEQIKEKLKGAYCPEKIVINNPVLDYAKHIIFRKMKSFEIERPAKFGGNLEIESYEGLEKIFSEGKLHPLDLKNAVAEALAEIMKPIRDHFEKNRKAKELYEIVKQQNITR